MFHFTKKRAVVAMAVVGSLALSVGAYAYFASTGSGNGSASVGTYAPVTIDQTGSPAALYPGMASPVGVTAWHAGPSSQYVKNVHLDSVDTGVGACPGTWFTMDDIFIGETLAANVRSDNHVGSLKMENTTTDQGACQGATLTLHFSISNN
jgi:hypothetical protein